MVWVALTIIFLLLAVVAALAVGTRFRQIELEARVERQQKRLNGLTRWAAPPPAADGEARNEEAL